MISEYYLSSFNCSKTRVNVFMRVRPGKSKTPPDWRYLLSVLARINLSRCLDSLGRDIPILISISQSFVISNYNINTINRGFLPRLICRHLALFIKTRKPDL